MRAQTTIDFAIGAAIFLAVLLFTFSFVPGILEPFSVGGEEEPIASDRAANTLTQDLIASPSEPNVLDRYCTVEFFRGNAPAACPYDGTTLEQQLSLASDQNVNVTIVGDIDETVPGTNPICWQTPGEPGLAEGPNCASGDVQLSAGDTPPAEVTTITARRVVWLHGEVVTLQVVMW
jgi:hypothetical protein